MNGNHTHDRNRLDQLSSTGRLDPERAAARRHHEEALGNPLAGLAQAFGRGAEIAAQQITRWHEARATRAALMRLSDRALADIGFVREDIPLVAKGFDPSDPAAHESAIARWLRDWRGYRRELSELKAYSDSELNDLGIRRADIPLILQAPALPRAA